MKSLNKLWCLGLCLALRCTSSVDNENHAAPKTRESDDERGARTRSADCDGRASGLQVELLERKRFGARWCPCELRARFTEFGPHRCAYPPGRVVAVRVSLGQEVAENTVLMEVDGAEMHHATADYFELAARLKQANDTLGRARALVTQGVGATAELRRARRKLPRPECASREAREAFLHFLTA